jgi:hypothetical protein
MKTYTGICIGGAAARKRFTMNAPYFRIDVTPERSYTSIPRGVATIKHAEYAEYRHYEWLGSGVWLSTTLTEAEALQELLTTYENSNAN